MSIDIDATERDGLAEVRAALTADLAAQTARLEELTEISADTGDPGEALNQEALAAAARQQIERISSALRRIAEGSYGRCEHCDTTIPAERLAILPHARYCVPCQQRRNG
ncbi:TraR/DksA family transcriptional regulator [Dactylosporangium sp. CA-052675]|uniref:TraR/DksA family transcriptional regulator n=1 Tax=Dactylosporangium sp. CA-052675 TaxID=3239927 RepID=UPI003D89EC90